MGTKDEHKIISFIHELLQDIKEIGETDKVLRDRKFADIKQFLVKNINLLFKIDKFAALNIFYEIGETSQTIYSIIEENMGNKLNFLSAVLKKFENEDFEMSTYHISIGRVKISAGASVRSLYAQEQANAVVLAIVLLPPRSGHHCLRAEGQSPR